MTGTEMDDSELVPGFPDYAIDDTGSVFSKRRGDQWKQLKPMASGKEGTYLCVALYDSDSKPHHFYIHRLMLSAYVGPCPALMECRHIDGNSHNNNLTNLAYGTRQQNEEDKMKHRKQREVLNV